MFYRISNKANKDIEEALSIWTGTQHSKVIRDTNGSTVKFSIVHGQLTVDSPGIFKATFDKEQTLELLNEICEV